MLINEWAIVFNLLSIALMGLLAATALLALIWPLIARHIMLFSLGSQYSLSIHFFTLGVSIRKYGVADSAGALASSVRVLPR